MRPAILALSLSLTCVIAIAVVAQQTPPPTFKSGTTFVQIDAIVTDRDGRLVPGLTKEDFELLEEGRPQTITTFSLVRVPVERSATSFGAAPEPDVASNRTPFTGRVFLLLLDDVHTVPARTVYVRRSAREFVERHMAANDLAAVVFTSGQTASQDLTSSRARLVATIDRFIGRRLISAVSIEAEDKAMNREVLPTDNPPPGLAGFTAELRILRGKTTLVALGRVAEFLGRIPSPRKTLVYFSEGVSDWLPPRSGTGRDPTEVREALREGIAAAGRGNVSIYTIGPQGLSAATDPATMAEGDLRRALADETGGIALPDSNDLSSNLARIVEDSSAYYLLGYYAPPSGRDDRFRKVEVRIKRSGLTVRARAGYYPRGTPKDSATTRARTLASEELQEALRSLLPLHGIVFSAAAAPFQGTAGKASVALVVEIDPSALRFSTRGAIRSTDLELHVTATDPDSKTPVHSMHHLAELRLRPETYEAVMAGGVRITRRLELAPGNYRVQIGVRDKTGGAIGTLFTDVDVPDFAKPSLAMSGIVLVSAATIRIPTVAPDAALAAVLPGAHTARREFPSNDTLVVFAEIYDNDRAAPQRLVVKTTVRDEHGGDAFANTAEHVSAPVAKNSARPRLAHQVTIPASALRPGRYVLRVEASPLAAGAPLVMREAPFVIR